MIISKFGGTSVADAPAIRRLVGIAATRRPDRPVVVVSALAGVTDSLIALARATERGDGDEVRSLLGALSSRHESVASELRGADQAWVTIQEDLTALRAEVEAALGCRPPPAELDAIVGRGELWSSRLVAAALEVARHALLQVARLADVQRVAARILHPVDAGTMRQRRDQLAGIEGGRWRGARGLDRLGHRKCS